jgi:hypothetical protein
MSDPALAHVCDDFCKTDCFFGGPGPDDWCRACAMFIPLGAKAQPLGCPVCYCMKQKCTKGQGQGYKHGVCGAFLGPPGTYCEHMP